MNTEEPKLNLPGPFCTRLPRIQRGTSPQLPDTDTGCTFSSPHDLARQKYLPPRKNIYFTDLSQMEMSTLG